MNVIHLLEREQEKHEVPVLRTGDTVRVHVKVVEGTRERIQVFEGIIIALGGRTGLGSSFTVRRVSHGVGVERTFLVHSPRLDKIEVMRHGKVRRAKLYYLRDKVGKRARIRERRQPIGGGASVLRRELESVPGDEELEDTTPAAATENEAVAETAEREAEPVAVGDETTE